MLSVLPIWFLLLMFCAICYLWSTMAMVQVAEKNNNRVEVSVSIGVIYEEDGSVGKMGLNCIRMALSDFYKSHEDYKTRILLHSKPYPKGSVVGAAAAALNLLKYANVKAIIGPTTSMEAEFVIHLGEKVQVPVISYSATSPFLSSIHSSYFILAAQKDSLQAQCISSLVEAFKWPQVVPIYEDSEYGAGLIPYLVDAIEQTNARIPNRLALSLSANDDQIHAELYKLKTMQTRVFIVHMSPELASRLFLRVNKVGMMNEGYVWITTTGISNELDSLDHSVIDSMQGVLGIKTFVPESKELKDFKYRWSREFQDMKLSTMGLWAYDAASALARAAEEVRVQKTVIKKKNMPANMTDLDTLDVSPIGPKLLQAVLNTSFIGLAGDFKLNQGQLESSTYQIINVNGNGGTSVGYWSPAKGLGTSSSSNDSLRAVVWPGKTTSTPKGWTIPVDGKKLRIGVPVKAVYKELVKVQQDNSTGIPSVSGFCIDVFDAVMNSLPYSVSYEYLPFQYSNGTPKGSYDDLVLQVFHKNYDAVVGDITIIANRSEFVDYTLPYTESGVIMVVPMRNDKERSAWVFLKPLTRDLWVATLCAFIFIAFVIWVLEHRINEDFRGPPFHQAGTSLFCSFSMMVFAQRENVFSNLSRFVVIIWVFVVLVLTQSYTASLTSMLTVEKLRPSVTDVNDLIHSGAFVGFQVETFVRGLLIGMGFHESKLVSYNSSEQLDDLLSKGTENGGIAAVIDEIPYMRLFLAKYSSKYTMVPPTYKTDGFGFAFPIGSPLVPDVSREILRVTEGDKMKLIEKAWGMSQDTSSSDEGSKVSQDTSSLSLESFRGLFLLVGVTAFFALCIFAITFLKEHRYIWTWSDASLWTKIRALATAFDQRDTASHTFKKTNVHSTRDMQTDHANIDGDESVELTPYTGSPLGASVSSDHIEDTLALSAGSTPPHPQTQQQ